MYQLSRWHKLGLVYIKPELSCREDKGHHIKFDLLKLARDPLKVVGGSPRDLLKILPNGSPVNVTIKSCQCPGKAVFVDGLAVPCLTWMLQCVLGLCHDHLHG